MRQRVTIIGGGLAGLTAATALAPRGFDVALYESRNRLGGRAGSFHDASTGQWIDTCQHVSMGCCTNLDHFCRTLGVDHFLAPQKTLYFMTPDRKVSRFRADAFPAPLHLARSFFTEHFLTPGEKIRIGYGLACLQRTDPEADPPFLEWLDRHGQTPRTVARFWGLVLVSALNETPDKIGLKYARKVFVDGFLTHPRGFEVQLPTVPLGRLYGEELERWLKEHRAVLHLQKGVRHVHVEDDSVTGMSLRDGTRVEADWYVSAMPFDRLLDLLPSEVVERHDAFRNLKNLGTSPIVSVHVWLDRPVTELPHVVLVDCVGQWVFNRGRNEAGDYYLQVVVSAARGLRQEGDIERQIVAELRQLFPAAAEVRRVRVITEHAATFSAVPGVDRWRPSQMSPLRNLFLAGDWTATGWPATMEGAVRSGYLAAETLLRKVGREERLVRPDLK